MSVENDHRAWAEIRKKVLERDGYQCRFCETTDEEHNQENGAGLDVHHIIPEGDGGEDTKRNLVALCRSCHRTMETLHGQAMGEIAEKKDHKRTLEGLTRTWRDYWDTWDEYDELLNQFISQNPVFRKRFGLYEENGGEGTPRVDSHELRKLAKETDGGISSEWECVAKFAYKEGVVDVVTDLDATTDVPIEGVEAERTDR